MKILFLTLGTFHDIEDPGIYTDLLREFRDRGHDLYIVCQREKRLGMDTRCTRRSGVTMLEVKTGNITKTNLFIKGINTLLLGKTFERAIKDYLKGIAFDAVLYSTPPITLVNLVGKIKRRDSAKTYLMLKDIFPQNAVDLKMIRNNGLLHRYFRVKEKKLYAVSDYIGCMSPGNVEYLLKHNPEVTAEKAGLCPNSILPLKSVLEKNCTDGKKHYVLPQNKTLFLYGGNLGKPQDVKFIVSCLKACATRKDCHFIICGNGTEYSVLERYTREAHPKNVTLLKGLAKKEYDELVGACDVGLVFLDYRFTIPNFPSRMLSYMEQGLPVLACTDTATDLGKVIMENEFGRWVPSNEVTGFMEAVDFFCDDRETCLRMGKKARCYLEKHYSVKKVCDSVFGALTNNRINNSGISSHQ